MSRPERRHAAVEARVGLAGVLCSLDASWVNYPSREADALKLRQLDAVRRCGLRVPQSLVTNTAVGVRSFAAAIGGPLAGKNLSAASLVSPIICRRRTPADSGPPSYPTCLVWRPRHTCSRSSSMTKRSRCERPWSGSGCFATAIHAGSEAARIDFRADYSSLDYSTIKPPPPVWTGTL
jgi:hypothetical protein